MNGCFWHGHSCKRGHRPATNAHFWNEKIEKNIKRDERVAGELAELGWNVLVVWQCELKPSNQVALMQRIEEYLSGVLLDGKVNEVKIMARRSSPKDNPESLRRELVNLLTNFSQELKNGNLRTKVVALVPAFYTLRDLGSSLIPKAQAASARDRIIEYMKQYPFTVIDGDELMVVSGINEWARRVRELRVEYGWWIYSGETLKEMAQNPDFLAELLQLGIDPQKIKREQYVLMSLTQDKQAAYRWNVLNDIRREKISVKDKIIKFLRQNVGAPVTGEELTYLANGRKEWSRRIRELRTEDGWPIMTKNLGRDDLPIGSYVLEEDRQAYEHDRKIPDEVRVKVLTRDKFSCTKCGWNRGMLSPDDPRKMLELHHKKHHKDGGENTVENLVTLCNVCHDGEHRCE